eukprot:SAG11_NODE_6144_length_1378_cov_1.407349_3_plen_129_part_00
MPLDQFALSKSRLIWSLILVLQDEDYENFPLLASRVAAFIGASLSSLEDVPSETLRAQRYGATQVLCLACKHASDTLVTLPLAATKNPDLVGLLSCLQKNFERWGASVVRASSRPFCCGATAKFVPCG